MDEGKELQEGETENEAVRRSMMDAFAVDMDAKAKDKV